MLCVEGCSLGKEVYEAAATSAPDVNTGAQDVATVGRYRAVDERANALTGHHSPAHAPSLILTRCLSYATIILASLPF